MGEQGAAILLADLAAILLAVALWPVVPHQTALLAPIAMVAFVGAIRGGR